MAQNKILIRVLLIFGLFAIIFAIAFGIGYCAVSAEAAGIENQYYETTEQLQISEKCLLTVDEWHNEDGYTDAVKGWDDYRALKQSLEGFKDKASTDGNDKYITEEQNKRLEAMEQECKDARSIKKLKELSTEFDLINKAIAEQKVVEENKVVEEVVYNYNYDYNYDYTPTYSSYNVSSDGLTPQSGVNSYDGRTETYYSSNVLYHQDTDNGTTDSEGFYRTSEGYYVVAASDMPQGAIFETSKGTAIVLDSGCDGGVTDFYVNG